MSCNTVYYTLTVHSVYGAKETPEEKQSERLTYEMPVVNMSIRQTEDLKFHPLCWTFCDI